MNTSRARDLRSTSATIIFLAIWLMMLTACNTAQNTQTDSSGAPSLPPTASMAADFTAMTDSTAQSALGVATVPSVTIQSVSYFSYAAFNVAGWNTVIRIGMAIPVAAFLESFHHIPVKQPDGSWVRSYSVTVGGLLYSAQLYAKVVDTEVHWDMYISKEGDYSKFNWFSGVSELGGTTGYWILQKDPDQPVPLLRIDWNWDAATDTGDIRYTNVEPGGAENGGYIYYGNNAPGPYQAFYDIYNKGQDDLIEIEMNTDTHEGRVRNLLHFGNEDWHYWDSNLQDTVPPA